MRAVPLAYFCAAPVADFCSALDTQLRFLEFFAASIRNPNTRRSYGRAVGEFLA